MTIALTGFMGCGKSCVGRILATLLGWEFIDLDEYIVHKTGRTISQLFTENVEKFRAFEAEAVRDIVTMKEIAGGNLVLALGGGTFCSDVLRDFLLKSTSTVWLRCSEETLKDRLEKDRTERPLLESESVGNLLSSRTAYYAMAEGAVDCDEKTPKDIALEIKELWNL